jgi:hypothetical protein
MKRWLRRRQARASGDCSFETATDRSSSHSCVVGSATNQKRGLSRTRRLRSFPSRSSLNVDPDFRLERGVFAGLEPCKHRGACKAPADPANRVTIARFGFVAVRGLRPAPARDDRQVRDQSERGTACRSERYSAPPRNPPIDASAPSAADTREMDSKSGRDSARSVSLSTARPAKRRRWGRRSER